MPDNPKYVSRRAMRGVCRMDSIPKSQMSAREECRRVIVDLMLAAESWEIEIAGLWVECLRELQSETNT